MRTTLLTLACLLVAVVGLETIPKVTHKRGIGFGYGTFHHIPSEYNKLSHYGTPFKYIPDHKTYLSHDESFFKHETKFPLGGPVDLGNYVHVKGHKNYAPSYMGDWKPIIGHGHGFHSEISSDFQGYENAKQTIGNFEDIPLSIQLPKGPVPSPIIQGASEGAVRTKDGYAQQGSAIGYQGLQGSEIVPSIELQSNFLQVSGKDFSPLKTSPSYEVVDENADKVPVAPPRPKIGRQLPPPPVSIATPIVNPIPGPKVGPVTFNPQSIGSGGLGVTKLQNGGFALGSGSYGYTQPQGQDQGQAQGQVQGQQQFQIPSQIQFGQQFDPQQFQQIQSNQQSPEYQQLQQDLQQQIQQQLKPIQGQQNIQFSNFNIDGASGQALTLPQAPSSSFSQFSSLQNLPPITRNQLPASTYSLPPPSSQISSFSAPHATSQQSIKFNGFVPSFDQSSFQSLTSKF